MINWYKGSLTSLLFLLLTFAIFIAAKLVSSIRERKQNKNDSHIKGQGRRHYYKERDKRAKTGKPPISFVHVSRVWPKKSSLRLATTPSVSYKRAWLIWAWWITSLLYCYYPVIFTRLYTSPYNIY